MTIYTVQDGDSVIEFVSLVEAQGYASARNLPEPGSVERETGPDYYTLVSAKIRQNQLLASELLIELYTENTLAGITTQESDELFDEYADVVARIREGAFPTAVYRLQQKQPSGFVTQELLDKWIATIQSYL